MPLVLGIAFFFLFCFFLRSGWLLGLKDAQSLFLEAGGEAWGIWRLNFPLGSLLGGVPYEALQQHAPPERLGSGHSVAGLKKEKSFVFCAKKLF